MDPGLNPGGHALTAGTCQRILHNILDKQSLPQMQIIAVEEKTQASGRSREPPCFTIYLSDGKFTIPCIAGLDIVWQLQTYRLRVHNVVQVVGYSTYRVPGEDNKHLSILIHNVILVRAHPGKIGQPKYPPGFQFKRSIAYIRLRDPPPTYEWLSPAHQRNLIVAPRLLQGGEANIPVDLAPVQPMGGWMLTVGSRPPNHAAHWITPGHSPLDAQGRVQDGLNFVMHLDGIGWRWGASFEDIIARQDAHPVNPDPQAASPSPTPPPPAPPQPTQGALRGPFAYPHGNAPPDLNDPAHPGFDDVNTLTVGQDAAHVWVRLTRIENKSSTVDLVGHDATGTIDIVVRPNLKRNFDHTRLRLGRCYQIFNAQCIASRVWCRTFHPVQLSINEECGFFEVDEPTIPEWILNYRKLNQLQRGLSNKPIDVWCVIMNTSEIIPGKPKGDAVKGWDKPPQLTRCEVFVTDKSMYARRLMAWDEFPEQLYRRDGEVVLLHNVTMEDGRANEICLKTVSGLTEILRGQDAPDLAAPYNDMVQWWQQTLTEDPHWNVLAYSCSADGAKALKRLGLQTRAPTVTIRDVLNRRWGLRQDPDFFKIQGRILVTNPGSITYVGYLLRFRIVDRDNAIHDAVAFNTATKGALGVSAEYMRQQMGLGQNDFEAYNLARWAIDAAQAQTWLMNVEARTEMHGPFKGRHQWIVTHFAKVD
ncbi:hypothetical protein CALCODRAFT_483855 [Calocera cornea HHB12733]|uniref:Uncharacterized protein n=1 Tax=Calocera cornea HHB12733 TaxID=1353952 RepID=A0A165FE42_9BASI|nr:hypothetical protein CALCODRAFT_483855 [Calocera cornea HHB12733]